MIINVIGWIIWVIVAIFALGLLLSKNRDGGVKSMMHTQGWVLILGLVATCFYLSKLNLIWIFVISYFIPMIVVRYRLSRGVRKFKKELVDRESK